MSDGIYWQNHISTDPKIMFGKPCIKGTRITIDLIIEKMGYGQTFEQILDAYPGITIEQIQACLLYAAKVIRRPVAFDE